MELSLIPATLRNGLCDSATEGWAALTYVCFLADVRIIADGNDFGTRDSPVLGTAESLLDCGIELLEEPTSTMEWLVGEEPLLLKRAGGNISLSYENKSEYAVVQFDSFLRALLGFASQSTCLVEERFGEVLQNDNYVELKEFLLAQCQKISVALESSSP